MRTRAIVLVLALLALLLGVCGCEDEEVRDDTPSRGRQTLDLGLREKPKPKAQHRLSDFKTPIWSDEQVQEEMSILSSRGYTQLALVRFKTNPSDSSTDDEQPVTYTAAEPPGREAGGLEPRPVYYQFAGFKNTFVDVNGQIAGARTTDASGHILGEARLVSKPALAASERGVEAEEFFYHPEKVGKAGRLVGYRRSSVDLTQGRRIEELEIIGTTKAFYEIWPRS
jgi:hypothetical protein